jgi:hypothetical protein
LRDDTVLGLRVLVSWDIMCCVVGLTFIKHHILQEHNAFIFTVIKNLSRTSQSSKKKALHSLKTLGPVNPIKQHSIPWKPESSTHTLQKPQITQSSWFSQSWNKGQKVIPNIWARLYICDDRNVKKLLKKTERCQMYFHIAVH